MQRFTKAAIISLALVVLLIAAGVYVASVGETDTKNSAVPKAQTVVANPPTPNELLRLVNEERVRVGVAPLVMREELNRGAQTKADDMFVNKYYDHVDASGKHGYMYAYEALPTECELPSENLMSNIDGHDTAADTVTAWKNSPAHYKAMIDPKFTITGFGIINQTVVEHFC